VAESRRGKGARAGETAAATGQAARAARGPRAATPRTDTSGDAAPAGGPAGRDAEPHARPGTAQDAVCPVAFCPICTAVSTVNRASPDVLQHLLLAGQQFLLALKAVVDARAADFEERDPDEPPIERIDIG
jgi:hypothetical protein